MSAPMPLNWEEGSADLSAPHLRADILQHREDRLFLFDDEMSDAPDASWLVFDLTFEAVLHRQSKVRVSANLPTRGSSSGGIYFAVHERLINSWISSCDKVAGVAPGTTFALEGEFLGPIYLASHKSLD